MYRRFRDTDVYESNGISKTITLSLNGINPVTVEGARASLHIEEDDSQRRLYVPKDERLQELCFINSLPKGLVNYLGIDDLAAIKVFGDVLKARPIVIDDLLVELSIIRLPWPDPGYHPAPSDHSFEDNAGNGANAALSLAPSQPSHSRSSTPGRGPSTPRPATSASSSFASRTDYSYERSIYTPATPSFTGSMTTPRSSLMPVPTAARAEMSSADAINNERYIALLDYVIASANGGECLIRIRMTAEITSSIDQNATPVALSDTPFGIRSENQIQHDIKLGAAGELYVRC